MNIRIIHDSRQLLRIKLFFEFIQRKGRFQYLSQIHAGDGFLKTLHAMAVGAGMTYRQ